MKYKTMSEWILLIFCLAGLLALSKTPVDAQRAFPTNPPSARSGFLGTVTRVDYSGRILVIRGAHGGTFYVDTAVAVIVVNSKQSNLRQLVAGARVRVEAANMQGRVIHARLIWAGEDGYSDDTLGTIR